MKKERERERERAWSGTPRAWLECFGFAEFQVCCSERPAQLLFWVLYIGGAELGVAGVFLLSYRLAFEKAVSRSAWSNFIAGCFVWPRH